MSEKQIGVVMYFNTEKQKLRLMPLSRSKERLPEENYRLSRDVEVTFQGTKYSVYDLRASDVVCIEYSYGQGTKEIKHIDVQAIGNSKASCSIASKDGSQVCSITCTTPPKTECKCTAGDDWCDCNCY